MAKKMYTTHPCIVKINIQDPIPPPPHPLKFKWIRAYVCYVSNFDYAGHHAYSLLGAFAKANQNYELH